MQIARSVHPLPGEAERKERLLGLVDGVSTPLASTGTVPDHCDVTDTAMNAAATTLPATDAKNHRRLLVICFLIPSPSALFLH
jgi:hypothetical protein